MNLFRTGSRTSGGRAVFGTDNLLASDPTLASASPVGRSSSDTFDYVGVLELGAATREHERYLDSLKPTAWDFPFDQGYVVGYGLGMEFGATGEQAARYGQIGSTVQTGLDFVTMAGVVRGGVARAAGSLTRSGRSGARASSGSALVRSGTRSVDDFVRSGTGTTRRASGGAGGGTRASSIGGGSGSSSVGFGHTSPAVATRQAEASVQRQLALRGIEPQRLSVVGGGPIGSVGRSPGQPRVLLHHDPDGLIHAGGMSGAARARTVSLNVLNSDFAPDAGKVLQNATTRESARLAADPSLALSVLRPGEYLAGTRSVSVARMQYGNAVERLVAITFNDSLGRDLVRYTGGPRGGNMPDFIDYTGQMIDITTFYGAARKSGRWYGGDGLITPTYARPSNFTVFPEP